MGAEMSANLVGQNLGPYRIVEQIGQGGMATVYKAYEPALDRYVAIKILPPYFAHDPSFSARFDREAKAVARLNHPNILPIYGFGQEAGLSYIAMRYVGEGTLKDRLGQSLDCETALDILRQVGLALDYAHREGIIHRDVKPSNVLIAEGHSQAPGGGNWVLLTDFGLARMVEGSSQLTKSGVGVGTPAYMSPEQGQGTQVDTRSDLYSLGVVLYEMLTGHVPYEAETPMAVVLKHITAPLPLPRSLNPALPEGTERVILKAMAKSPEDRYETAQAMVDALERALEEAAPLEWPPEERIEAEPALPLAPQPPAEPAPAEPQPIPVPPAEAPLAEEVLTKAPPVEQVPATPAVPFLKRVPLWAWGVIGLFVVLVVVGGVLLASSGGQRDMPTDTLAPDGSGRWVSLEPCQGIEPWQFCVRDEESGEVMQLTHDLDFAEPGGAVWSPDGERIAFNAGSDPGADGQHDHNLYLINADGSGLRPITEGEASDVDPSWSPDGKWIAFHRDCGLWVVRPDGSDARELLGGSDELCIGDITWSRDAERIAFVNWFVGDGVHEIWVVDSDGQDPHIVYTLEKEAQWVDLAWSPEEDLLAFVCSGEGWTEGLVFDPEGGEPEWLEEDELPWHWFSYLWQWEGEWAPVASAPPAPGGPEHPVCLDLCEGVEPWQICMRDQEGGEVVQLTHDLDFGQPGAIAWSPDGEQIVFNAGSGPDANGGYDHNLYIINADGSDLRQITEGWTGDVDPSWSPDGEWIAFHRDCGLWIVRPDGGDARELLGGSDELCVGGTSWSRDAQRIAFVNWHNEDGVQEVWVVGRDGGEPSMVYTFEKEVHWLAPAWSPGEDLLVCLYWWGEDAGEGVVIDPEGGEPQRLEGELPWHWLANCRLQDGH